MTAISKLQFLLTFFVSGLAWSQTQTGANVYEIRKDSDRIGYISFLDPNDSETKFKVLEQVRHVFEPTSIEEVGNQEAVTYTGVKYYLGKDGTARIVLHYRGLNNRFQVTTSRALTEKIDFDMLYRGNRITNYWTTGMPDGDIKATKLPLNLTVEGQTLSINDFSDWEPYTKTLNLDIAYRGHPGEILYLAPKHGKDKNTRASQLSGDFFNVLKNGSLFSIPVSKRSHEELKKIFNKSDGDCAYFGKVVQYFYCSDTHESYRSARHLAEVLKEQPWTGYMTYEFPTGVVEIGIARNFADNMFFALVNELRPKVAYSGRKDTFFRRSSENIDIGKVAKSDSNIQANPSYLQDFRADFYDEKSNRIAWTRFWLVDELTRTKIISLYREFLEPDHLKLLNVESPIRDVASPSEKVVGMYFEKDRNWWTRNLHRYANKPGKNLMIGIDRYDYQTTTNSTISYLTRGATSVMSYATMFGQWWPQHSLWGVTGSLRLASLSHAVNLSTVNGLVYEAQIDGTFRYFFNESVVSPELQFGIGYAMDVDSIDSNSVLGSLTLVSFPLNVRYSRHFGEAWKGEIYFAYSPFMTVTQSFASAVGGSGTGSRLQASSTVFYQYANTPFSLLGKIHYSKSHFEIGGGSGDKTELGAMVGVSFVWD